MTIASCSLECDVMHVSSVLCTTDADCKDLVPNMKFTCKPGTENLVGVKSCQQ